MYKCKVFEHTSNGQVTKTGYNFGRIGSNKYYFYETGVVGKEAFHIYILAPEGETLTKGDWCYCMGNDGSQHICKYNSKLYSNYTFVFKIIVSTDYSLNLPRPSNEFLKKYCEEGGIDEVNVEYNNSHNNIKIFI